MFRLLYGKVLCVPCSLAKKRALACKAKPSKKNKINAYGIYSDTWTLNDEIKKNSTERPSTTITIHNKSEEEEEERFQRASVPLTLTMIIMVVYICIGSALLHSFEGWSVTQAGYFCFTTLGKGSLKY